MLFRSIHHTQVCLLSIYNPPHTGLSTIYIQSSTHRSVYYLYTIHHTQVCLLSIYNPPHTGLSTIYIQSTTHRYVYYINIQSSKLVIPSKLFCKLCFYDAVLMVMHMCLCTPRNTLGRSTLGRSTMAVPLFKSRQRT